MRAPVLVTALLLQVTESVRVPQGPFMDPEFFKWAISQGGLAVITIIIVWSYRKDLGEVLSSHKDKIEILKAERSELMDLIRANTEAMTRLADTVREDLPRRR